MTHTNKALLIMMTAGLTVMFASCRIYDPIHDASNPDDEGLKLTTEWSQRTEGVEIPSNYKVELGGYSETHTGQTQIIDHIFNPDTYRLRIWHQAQHIGIDGTVASVAPYTETREEEEYGGLIEGNPGWLFTCAMDLDIDNDKHEVVAPMRQQVRRLTIVLKPTGGSVERISRIYGTLMGVAGTLDFDTDKHGLPSDVLLFFEKNAEGNWQATVHLLGVAGDWQNLFVEIDFEDNIPEYITLDSDLTNELIDFNVDKKTPMIMTAQVIETQAEAGFSASITDWHTITETIITE